MEVIFRVVVFDPDLKAFIHDMKQAVLKRRAVCVLGEDDTLRQDPRSFRDVT